ncbi:MAG: hypothetical protein ABR537_02095 [Gemmatimonadales bacterium]
MKRYTVAVLFVGALACTDSNAPSPPPVPPPPAPGASFAIEPALDTVLIDQLVEFVAQHADSTEDQWSISDSSIARLSIPKDRGRAMLQGLRPGTVTIKARHQGDSGQATLVIRQPVSFVVAPGLDTIPVGSGVRLDAAVRDSVDQWVISDTSLARLGPHYGSYAYVVTRAPGTVTVIARRGVDSGVARLVVLEPAPPAGWDVINLGVLDAVLGRPVAINDSGTIVGLLFFNPHPLQTVSPDFDLGWQYEGQYEKRGFIYSHGMMRQLSGLDTVPLAIGPSGTIVGTDLTQPLGQFLIWEPGAGPRPLSNGTYHWAWGGRIIGVNARGDILASIGEDGPESSTALYQTGRLWRSDSVVDLGQLNPSVAKRTLPMAWNTRGQIVGFSTVAVIYRAGDNGYPAHPFLWENGVMRDLGILGSSPCGEPVDCGGGVARAINIDGTVVGQSTAVSSYLRAFIWENGEMRDLGPFPGQNTNALAINDRGQVLGTVDRGPTFVWKNGETQIVPFDGSLLGPNGEVVGTRDGHIFIWEAGQVTDLGEGSPIAMNSRGEIIGTRGALPTLWRKKP